MKNAFLVLIFPFFINAQTAFISGNDTICDNGAEATIKVDFTGTPPFTFLYSVNGIYANSITTQNTPYYISANKDGVYSLVQFNDATIVGSVSGSGLVTKLESPTAIIHLESDTLSIIYPMANFVSNSIGNIVSWDWDFGNNTSNEFSKNVSHSYDSLGRYQASLIVIDNNGCSDTAINSIYIRNEFWIYIPNSFTPNNEEPNNKFCIQYNGIRDNTFLFKVFNSQGELMFQSANPLELKCSIGGGWAGKDFNDNIQLPLDTYAYEIYFQDFEGWKHQEFGIINLIR